MSNRIARLLWATCLLVGCEGVLTAPPLPGADEPLELNCEMSQYPDAGLDDAMALFVSTVYPAMTEGQGQCISCHDATAHRRFTVAPSGAETFHQARAGGFFNFDPGSVLARLASIDDSVRMPQAAPAWPQATVRSLAQVACMVAAADTRGGPAADEQFPPELLVPYTGPAISSYDNPFLNFIQLKHKVKSIFGDDWVRDGVDQFGQNIGLFGGVDFATHFVEARVATADFLLGLDALAPDVCSSAADAGSGPFTGLALTVPLIDVPTQSITTIELETIKDTGTMKPPAGCGLSTSPAGLYCVNNCTVPAAYPLVSPGTYRVTVRGKPTLDGNGVGPELVVKVGTAEGATHLAFTNPTAYEEKSVDIVVPEVGTNIVSLNFINDAVADGGDRNIYLDYARITGPLGPGTGTTRADAAKETVSTVYKRMLYREATPAEQTSTYALLRDLAAFGSPKTAWSGVCEALVRHPDFLFTMPPSVETVTGPAQKDPLRLVGLTQRALGRPPTGSEFSALGAGGFSPMVEAVFASPDFRPYYFSRIQLRIESQGTPDSDEPARLWTYVTLQGRSFEEVLTADYTVDEAFQQQPRPTHHGKTGLLTARGYLNNKPGLPHYNFPARVFSGFMGSIFEVPPEVFDQRGAATATSTVDPQSVCFSCHQLLTPLAHQRLRWNDDGTYLDGAIDDSDRNLVASYPYKGVGLEAFTTKAVKKEPFIRRMINTQVHLLLGRELRSQTDERLLYKQLWDASFANGGDMRAVLKQLATSPTFQGP